MESVNKFVEQFHEGIAWAISELAAIPRRTSEGNFGRTFERVCRIFSKEIRGKILNFLFSESVKNFLK